MKKFKENQEPKIKRTTIMLDQNITDYLADISQNEIFDYSWQVLTREVLNEAVKDQEFLKKIFTQKVEKLKKVLNSI